MTTRKSQSYIVKGDGSIVNEEEFKADYYLARAKTQVEPIRTFDVVEDAKILWNSLHPNAKWWEEGKE